MEITLMENGQLKETISLPLGSIPLTKRFNNIESEDNEIELNKFLYEKLNEISWLRENSKLNIIGIGGIAKHIGRVSKGDEDYPKELLHKYSITRDEISKIYGEFLKLSVNKRSEFKGLSKKKSRYICGTSWSNIIIT